MKYAVTVSSRTGNTALLGEVVKEVIPQEECIYYGQPDRRAADADLIFVGFWTDKGICDEETLEFLETLEDQRIFLFGTAGFGKKPDYFEQILERVKLLLKPSCTVAGSYMCQGHMEMSVRRRYEKMQEEQPDDPKYEALIANFDAALSHPDREDLEKLKEAVKEIIK